MGFPTKMPMMLAQPVNDYEELLHAFAVDIADRIKNNRFPPGGYSPRDVSVLMDMALGVWATATVDGIYRHNKDYNNIQRAIGSEARHAALKVSAIYAAIYLGLKQHITIRDHRDVPTFAAKLLEAYNACSGQR